MIITCEKCSTRFKLDESRLPAKGAKVRCSRCKHAFFVQPGDPGASASGDSLDDLFAGSSAAGDRAGSTQDLSGSAALRAAPPAAETGGFDLESSDLPGAPAADGGVEPEEWTFSSNSLSASQGTSASGSGSSSGSFAGPSALSRENPVDFGQESGLDAAEDAVQNLLDEGTPAEDLFDSNARLDTGLDELLDAGGSGGEGLASDFGDDSLELDDQRDHPAGGNAGAGDETWDGSADMPTREFDPAAVGAAPKRSAGADPAVAIGRIALSRTPVPLPERGIPAVAPVAALPKIVQPGPPAAWVAVALLLLAGLAGSLRVDEAEAPVAGVASAPAGIEVRMLNGRWVENAVRGPIYVVDAELAGSGTGQPTPERIGLRLLDASGRVLVDDAGPLGLELPAERLREAAPAELIAELAASAERNSARPIPPGASLRLQAVLEKVPAEAARFEIVALPGA